MKRLILTSIIVSLMLAFSTFTSNAQEPVNWTATAKMTSENQGVVTITATIDAGWHVYGTKLPDVGPSPTKLVFSGKGIKFLGNVKVWPAPITEMDAMFEAELSYWENKVRFTRKFACNDPATAEIKVSVSYMCCNDSSCRPPKTQEFTLKIEK